MEKVCSKCKMSKDINEFHIERRNKDGRKYNCKACCEFKYRQGLLKDKIIKTHKICAMCKEDKLCENFHKNISNRDGLFSYCRECSKIWREPRKSRARESAKRRYYCNGGKEKYKQKEIELKYEVVANYGGCCVCCGETNINFLTIDHINGGGSKHRKEVGGKICRWLKKNNFPKDNFQLLCYNCNCAKGVLGECPHKKMIADIFSSIIDGV